MNAYDIIKEPLEINSEDIVDAFHVEGTEEDSPTYRHIRKIIKKFLNERYEYYPINSLANFIGVPISVIRKILTPTQIAQVNTKVTPVHVMVSDITVDL